MMNNRFNNFIGIQTLPQETQQIMRVYSLIHFLISFSIHLSSTFLILFAIDEIGFVQAGIMASIMFTTQILFDYPSGSLGDWIGQRWVLVLAYVSHGLGFLLLNFSQTFVDFLFIGIVIGFANAQSSGALETWLDNNYQTSVGEVDKGRKLFGFSISRIESLGILPAVVAFILGGILSSLFSRQFVFLLQAFLVIILIFLIIIMIKDVQSTEKIEEMEKKSESNFLSYLKGGIKYFFSSKSSFFLILGLALHDLVLQIFGTLLLLPLFFAYSGSDLLTSIMRTIIWLVIFPLNIYMAGVSKKLSNNKLSLTIGFHGIFLFVGWILVILSVPIENSFNIVGLLGIMIVAVSVNGTLLALISILRRRILLDDVPTENRNSVYSLIPTIVAIFGIPIIPFVGLITEIYGLVGGILIALLITLGSSFFIFSSFIFKASELKKWKNVNNKGSFGTPN
ncbi:MAG: hypothetical protein HeimC3_22300 [Candidatus Heimdallarchaeota archaeon LC_3]|nr:MAG: hypothetical protein HeimC3_22300 [Candidatus Heimdallarchaeota archaeon LC_3]